MERSDDPKKNNLMKVAAGFALGAASVTMIAIGVGTYVESSLPEQSIKPVGETVISPAEPLEEETTIGVLDVAVIGGLAVGLVYSIGRITNGDDSRHNFEHYTGQALDTLLDDEAVKTQLDDIVQTNKLNSRFMAIVKDVNL